MKNLKLVFALTVLLGSTGMAAADPIFYGNPGPVVSASVSFPGFRLVVGRPGYYCWYQGRYYSRAAWDRFYRLHRDRVAYRYDRDRHFDGHDRDFHRD